jgi:5'-deoxy-5'-methylthioadenosine phosphorylase
LTDLALIGGSGLTRLDGLDVLRREQVTTPYGDPSAPLTYGEFDGRPLVFLPRHGSGHTLPPHRINFRANLWALREAGIRRIYAVAAVGGIAPAMAPGVMCVPDQLIDYTWGRAQTFFDGGGEAVTHVDFTQPYCEEARQDLLRGARAAAIGVVDGGCYGVTEGPRLETAAEVRRLERDGCDVVGMTCMPEAVLARELGLCYACLAVNVNWAAGKGEGPITMAEIEVNLDAAMQQVRRLLAAAIRR